MKVCVIAKLSLSENKREFLYNIFLSISVHHTTFRGCKCVSICAYMWSCEYEM